MVAMVVHVQDADLAGHSLAFNGRLDRAAVAVPQHYEDLDAQNSYAIFEARRDLGRGYVPGYADDEELADALVEDKLHRHPRIRAS